MKKSIAQYYEVPYLTPGLGTGHEIIALRTTKLDDAIKVAEIKIKHSYGSIWIRNVQIFEEEDGKISINREDVLKLSKDGEKKYLK